MEGKDPILDGGYQARINAIHKCYEAAKRRGYRIFALQDSGWCASSSTAEFTYDKYGTHDACASDGEGGPLANQVYFIRGAYVSLLFGAPTSFFSNFYFFIKVCRLKTVTRMICKRVFDPMQPRVRKKPKKNCKRLNFRKSQISTSVSSEEKSKST